MATATQTPEIERANEAAQRGAKKILDKLGAQKANVEYSYRHRRIRAIRLEVLFEVDEQGRLRA